MQRLVFAQCCVSGTAVTDVVTSWRRCSCGGCCRSQCSHLCKSHCESHHKGQLIGRCIGQCSVMQRLPRPVWRSSACGSSQHLFVSLLIYGRELLGLLRLFRATLARGSRPARCSRRQPGRAAISVCGRLPVAAGSPRRVWCCNYRCVTPAAGLGSVLARVFDLRFQLQGSRSPVAPGRAGAVDPRGRAEAVIPVPATGRCGRTGWTGVVLAGYHGHAHI